MRRWREKSTEREKKTVSRYTHTWKLANVHTSHQSVVYVETWISLICSVACLLCVFPIKTRLLPRSLYLHCRWSAISSLAYFYKYILFFSFLFFYFRIRSMFAISSSVGSWHITKLATIRVKWSSTVRLLFFSWFLFNPICFTSLSLSFDVWSTIMMMLVYYDY